jgi:hypothetical protein
VVLSPAGLGTKNDCAVCLVNYCWYLLVQSLLVPSPVCVRVCVCVGGGVYFGLD